jgi:hypothetical protein
MIGSSEITKLDRRRVVRRLAIGHPSRQRAQRGLDDGVMRCRVDRLLASLPHLERRRHLDDPSRRLGVRRAGDLPAPIVRVCLLSREVRPQRDHVPFRLQIENGHVTSLEFQADDLHDVSPVQAFRRLKGLFCYRTAGRKGDFSDLSSLQGLPLENLYCGLTAVADLSPLRDMQLSFLNIGVTNVRDLSPLSGMRLRSLDLGATPVSSLAPLTGMPLEYLNCSTTNVTDLSPLQGMPLKKLRCDFVLGRDAEILHSIPTLETINEKPVAEFWADVEDERFETSP